jgi:hypothetical protein
MSIASCGILAAESAAVLVLGCSAERITLWRGVAADWSTFNACVAGMAAACGRRRLHAYQAWHQPQG